MFENDYYYNSNSNLFSFKGRINRVHFILTFTFWLILLSGTWAIPQYYPNYIRFIFDLILNIILIMAILKRLRDLKLSLWLMFILFIPFINFLFMFVMLFKKGCYDD